MGRSLRTMLLAALLLGCGGNKNQNHSAPVGFLNQTRHPDADLWTIWSVAQNSIANQINLNPVQQIAEDAPPVILPGDSRALSVVPDQLTVAPQPDVSSTVLAAAGIQRPDPTGMIACPAPCNVRYTTAYSRYQPAATVYASSWESSDNNFRIILEHEFENQILFALGYDMTWR
jgi:hypothetical protein